MTNGPDALAGSRRTARRTTQLIEILECTAERQGLIARDLMRDASMMQGGQIIGSSPSMACVRQELELVTRSDFTVLITRRDWCGEGARRPGHPLFLYSSGRRAQPLIYVNCAALPESLAESELFGHLRGAFTGASAERPGKFEVADGGTPFLDEIGELPLVVQPKLLRALQEGEIQRVGADRVVRVDVRVLSATNRNLEDEVKAGRFRLDLFHRLNVFPLMVPPLRDRSEDVPLLAGFFCDTARRRLGLGPALADEPTAPLDLARAMVVVILDDMARKFETAIIIVTHDEKIIPTFKRIHHIRDGVTHEEAGEGRTFA